MESQFHEILLLLGVQYWENTNPILIIIEKSDETGKTSTGISGKSSEHLEYEQKTPLK